jgi:hypothetical protein
LLHIKFPIGPKLRFRALKANFCLQPLKTKIFLLQIEFPIDGYVTRPKWFLDQNFVLGHWRLNFTFFTPKSINFLAPYTTRSNLFLGPNSVSTSKWNFYHLIFKRIFFLLHIKFSIDGYITRPYSFWSTDSVIGLW